MLSSHSFLFLCCCCTRGRSLAYFWLLLLLLLVFVFAFASLCLWRVPVQSNQTQAVRRIVACVSAVRLRTVGGAFAHWCSQINRHIAADISHRAKSVDAQYRTGLEEIKLLQQQVKHHELSVRNMQQELVDTQGHVSELQSALSSSRAAYTQVMASETALRLRVEQLQEAKNQLDGDGRVRCIHALFVFVIFVYLCCLCVFSFLLFSFSFSFLLFFFPHRCPSLRRMQIATERVLGLSRELDNREAMLRAKEARLVQAEESVGQLTADNHAKAVKLKSLAQEAARREDNFRDALRGLGQARTRVAELEGELQALRDSERGIAEQELQLQARMEAVMGREQAVAERAREVNEQQAALEEVTAARERVLAARELLVRQTDKAQQAAAARVTAAQAELGPVQALQQRATTAESMLAVAQGQKQDLEQRLEDVLRSLREERARSAAVLVANGGGKQLVRGARAVGGGWWCVVGGGWCVCHCVCLSLCVSSQDDVSCNVCCACALVFVMCARVH